MNTYNEGLKHQHLSPMMRDVVETHPARRRSCCIGMTNLEDGHGTTGDHEPSMSYMCSKELAGQVHQASITSPPSEA